MPAAPPIALINARLVDPASETETRGGLIARDGVIEAVGSAVTRDQVPADALLIDCRGDVVAPGLVDMRAYVGEPGAEHRETIASASAAAAAGGVTSIVMRPDTNPPVDDPAVVDFILRRARDDAKVRIFPSAALTKRLEGREIAEIGLLVEAGAVAFSDGARSVDDAQTMRRAMAYARDFDALVAPICQDRSLAGEGVMAEESARELAGPARHTAGGRDHRARARPSPRGADGRAIPRRARLQRPLARRDEARAGGRGSPRPAAYRSII